MVAAVFDVTSAAFQDQVVKPSMQTPVLLDFWAGWCAPCKTLGPVLEKLAVEFGGAFRLGKVDVDREQELAYAFQAQSIPLCVLVDQGRPVDGFQGAITESEVRRFLQRNGIEPLLVAAADEPAAAPAPVVDPNSPAARLSRALEAATAGDAAAARAALDGFPEEDESIDRARRLGDGLQLLEANLKDGAAGAEGLLAMARQAFLAADFEGAMEQILKSVQADKTFRSGLARRAMLLCFLAIGETDEVCDGYRRRLATLLY